MGSRDKPVRTAMAKAAKESFGRGERVTESTASPRDGLSLAGAPLCSPVDNDKDSQSQRIVHRSQPTSLKEREYSSLEEDGLSSAWNKPPRARDLLIFLAGLSIGILALVLGEYGPWRKTESPEDCFEGCLTGPWLPNLERQAEAQEVANESQTGMWGEADGPSRLALPLVLERAKRRRFAYVLMAYDTPGKPLEYLWRAVAMLHGLKRLTDYPVLLMTNTTQFPDGTRVDAAFAKLGVKVMPVQAIIPPPQIEETLPPAWRIAYWKVQIWRFTQYEKLLWLDTDAVLTRSVDHLFELEPPWAQRDVWVCKHSSSQEWPCSGLMLIRPSEHIYQSILKYVDHSNVKMWVDGDQRLLQRFFIDRGTPMQLLPMSEAAFGKCMGVVPNAFNETPGEVWNMPAFVHKSSVRNECFFFIISRQLRKVDGQMINVCHHHPLGGYWRELFCQGLWKMGVKTTLTEVYCDDFMWHRHR